MLIFLDIDGVLVPAASWRIPQLLPDGFPAFTLKSTKALQTLLSDQDTLILISSHRDRFSDHEWIEIFKNRGVRVINFKRIDSSYKFQNRKDELLDWFTTHPIEEDFVIIDDDTSLNSLPTQLKEHLVLTSPYIGLTPSHVDQIQSIIRRSLV